MQIDKNGDIPGIIQPQTAALTQKTVNKEYEQKKVQAQAQDGLESYGRVQVKPALNKTVPFEKYKAETEKKFKLLYPDNANRDKIINIAAGKGIDGLRILDELIDGALFDSASIKDELEDFLYTYESLCKNAKIPSKDAALKITQRKIQKLKTLKLKYKNNKNGELMVNSGVFNHYNLDFLAEYLTQRELDTAMIIGRDFASRKNASVPGAVNPLDLVVDAGFYDILSKKIENPRIKDLTDKGVFLYDAVAIENDKDVNNLYKKYEDKGITASVLANIKDVDLYNEEDLTELITLVSSVSDTTKSDISASINRMLSDKDIDLKSFNEYLSKIDFENLFNISPRMKNFTFEEMITFLEYHFKADATKTKFEESDLTLGNLTEYLQDNLTNSDELTNILCSFPNTPREIGEFPSGWLDNIQEENKPESIKAVYDAISKFQKSGSTSELAKNLTQILGKQVKVSQAGNPGLVGKGYKLSVEGADDMCLKIYHNDIIPMRNIHGEHIEPQMGLFLNKHSNDFVKMFFGRVSGNYDSDGFIVSQFLAEDVKPYIQTDIEDGYVFIPNDTRANSDNNIKQGKVIDFGDVDAFKIKD